MPALILFGLMFSVLFVNDYKLAFDLPALYPAWLALMAVRMVCRLWPSRGELLAQGALLLLLTPSFLVELTQSSSDYFHAYLGAVIAVNAVFGLPRLCRDRHVVLVSLGALLVVGGLGLYQLVLGVSRGSLVFGPNVLYRAGAFFFGVFWVGASTTSTPVSGKRWMVMAYAAFSLIMAFTGSRGAMVTWAVLSVGVYAALGLRFRKGYMKPLVLFALLIPVLAGYVLLQERVWRLTYFSLANASESIRLDFFYQGLEYLQQTDWMIQLFGVGSEVAVNRYFGFYPHNIFLESLVYGGWWLLCWVGWSFVLFFRLLVRPEGAVLGLVLPLAGVFVGSLFSGDLWYNFTVLSVGIVFMMYGVQSVFRMPVRG